jgi:hypothetical protein
MNIAHIFEVILRLKEKKRPAWGSAGGFYKRFAAPRRPPFAGFQRIVGQV